ncbi:leucine-rich_repeat domain-containing protein [Hexamita inflata]|uniref:Leucine-rich repeat domain-containing protein n=1 Tax=Hexamita inflata TaxID=28002 RepID=A0AA86THQ7_9EUKA|nr:leucine-rich repeat domain-containing protein [Hexamita inflata]
MQQYNHVIRNKVDLLNHFRSSRKLEILYQEQMKDLLEMNVPPGVWKDASNRNLLSFNQEFVQETKKFRFQSRKIEYFYLVSYLTNLTELNLYNNKISDISSISKLKNLKKLYLERNCIEDISALQSLHDLTHLYLSYNKSTSYTLALPNLVDLELSDNKLQDKSGLQHSPKLESLNLSRTETTDLSIIPHQLFGLKKLHLSSNNITEISYLSNFVGLQILDLGGNEQLQNIGPLKFCTQLTQLTISETRISDIWPLQFLKNLKTLQMTQTQVIDLHPLQNLYKLEQNKAFGACIIDVSPLSKLTQLDYLDFRNNKITNADSLKHDNFSEYDFSDQEVPTTDKLKFYNKILSVPTSRSENNSKISEPL